MPKHKCKARVTFEAVVEFETDYPFADNLEELTKVEAEKICPENMTYRGWVRILLEDKWKQVEGE